MPSVRRIREFIEYVFNKAQLEIDGLIIAFIYLERLLAKASRDGVHLLYSKNWRTLCFISLVLASKIWDDFSMDNADFAVGKWLVCAGGYEEYRCLTPFSLLCSFCSSCSSYSSCSSCSLLPALLFSAVIAAIL